MLCQSLGRFFEQPKDVSYFAGPGADADFVLLRPNA